MSTVKQITQIPITEAAPPAAPPGTPAHLLNLAISQGASVETLDKLMALYERWEANQARRAFDKAMAAAKPELPLIVKNRTVDFSSGKGRTNYKFEDLHQVLAAVEPVLGRHGLYVRYRTTSDKEHLTVTCILHGHGHSEENSLTGPNDTSGNKNPIQAIGSAQTYLQRYTLKAALGLAASADDQFDAGAGDLLPAGSLVSAEQIEALTRALEVREMPEERLINFLRAAYRGPVHIDELKDIPATLFKRCLDKIQSAGEGK